MTHPADALRDLMIDTMTSGKLDSIDGSVEMMQQMQAILGAVGAEAELPPELTGIMDRLAQMQQLAQQASAAEKCGDYEAMSQFAHGVADLGGGSQVHALPASPEVERLFDAIDECDAVAVRDALADCDVNAVRGAYGETPLYSALSSSAPSLEIVTILLERGADPRRGLNNGSSVLSGAAFGSFEDWAQGDLAAVVTACVALGAGIEARGDYDWTPLHWAIMEHNPRYAAALLAAGADPDAAFSDASMPPFTCGQRPLHVAAGWPDTVQVLLDHGADVAALNAQGETAADYIQRQLEGQEDAAYTVALALSLDLIRGA